MLKRNGMILLAILMVLIITILSHAAIEVTILLIIFTLLFLIPYFRETVFQQRLRKIKVALYTTITFSIGLTLLSLQSFFRGQFYSADAFAFTFVVFVYSLLGNVIYGLPVSVLAEFISTKIGKRRMLVNGLTHIFFGFVTVFLIQGFMIFALVCSVLFFIFDEIMSRKAQTYKKV